MAVKTYRLGVGADGVFAALSETDQTAASRADGWTVGKIASTNASDFAQGTKQATGSFGVATAKPSAINVAAGSNASKTPAALTGTYANTAWTFTFAVRAVVLSAQAGRMRLRVYRSTSATGSGATEITSAAQVGTTSTVLSTTADVTSVVTWSPGAITLNNEYLFFVLAWEITTASGSNTGDVVLRTGQSAAGSRVVTPDFAIAPTAVTVSGVVSAQQFGIARQTVQVQGITRGGLTATIVDQFVVDDGHLVDGGGGGEVLFGTPTAAITIPAQNVPVSGKTSAAAFGAVTIITGAVSKPAGGVSSAQSFGALTIRGAITRTVGSVSSAQSFGVLAFRVTLGSGGVLTAQAFGTPTTKAVITSTVTGLGTAQSFGALTIRTAVSRTVVGLGSAQAFGTVTAVVAGGGAIRLVSGIASAQAFGVPTIKATATVQVPGITRDVAYVGLEDGSGHVLLETSGGLLLEASPVLFGTPTLVGAPPPQTVQVPGLQQATGVYSIVGGVVLGDGHVVGGSGALFGFVTIIPGRATVSFATFGLPSAQLFGQVTITWPQSIPVQGIGSAQLFGRPFVANLLHVETCTTLTTVTVSCVSLTAATVGCGPVTVTTPTETALTSTPSSCVPLILVDADV